MNFLSLAVWFKVVRLMYHRAFDLLLVLVVPYSPPRRKTQCLTVIVCYALFMHSLCSRFHIVMDQWGEDSVLRRSWQQVEACISFKSAKLKSWLCHSNWSGFLLTAWKGKEWAWQRIGGSASLNCCGHFENKPADRQCSHSFSCSLLFHVSNTDILLYIYIYRYIDILYR